MNKKNVNSPFKVRPPPNREKNVTSLQFQVASYKIFLYSLSSLFLYIGFSLSLSLSLFYFSFNVSFTTLKVSHVLSNAPAFQHNLIYTELKLGKKVLTDACLFCRCDGPLELERGWTWTWACNNGRTCEGVLHLKIMLNMRQ